MEESPVLKKIEAQFGDAIIGIHSKLGEETVTISRARLTELAAFLKAEPGLEFDYLMDLTAVDYFKRRPRFEVVYHFFSLRNRLRFRVKTPVGEPDLEVDSLVPLYPSANWYEREVFDMYGIRFKNHPDLRRILMYPEFEGHPLRKDYPIDKRQPLIGPQD